MSLVVIGGWLGCQPRHLKRYETLYNSLGFDSKSFVVSPISVVDSTLSPLQNRIIQIPSSDQWPPPPPPPPPPNNSSNNVSECNIGAPSSCGKFDTIEDLAWKVLGDVYNSKAEIFIFHAFSNGGCFLWESLCQILLLSKNHHHQKDRISPEITAVLKELSIKCKGVVFDSCPCWFGLKGNSNLFQAIQYCSEEEKQRIISVFGNDERIFTKTTDENILNRNLEYFHNLTACPFDIPQLYLYSKNDDLAKHEYIIKMINNRRSRQKQVVLQRHWDKSIHCAHLREHGDDYEKAVKEFIQQIDILCTSKARL